MVITEAGTVESSSAMMVRPSTRRSNVRLSDVFGRLAGGDGGGESAVVGSSCCVVAGAAAMAVGGVSSTLIRADCCAIVSSRSLMRRTRRVLVSVRKRSWLVKNVVGEVMWLCTGSVSGKWGRSQEEEDARPGRKTRRLSRLKAGAKRAQ